jgi:hypothetical protein
MQRISIIIPISVAIQSLIEDIIFIYLFTYRSLDCYSLTQLVVPFQPSDKFPTTHILFNMNKAVSTRAVDTSQGSPLVDPKKIRLTSLAPGEQQISLNLSDGTSVQPHLLRSGDEAEQHPVRIPSHDHYWIKASDHSVAKRKWLKTLGQALASHLSIGTIDK